MKYFQLWSVEIFFPGFCHVHLALNKWYSHWDLESRQEKGGKEKKSDKIYWNSSPIIIFPVQNINNLNNIYQNIHTMSYKEIMIHLGINTADFLLSVRWNLALKFFCSIGSMGPCVQLDLENLQFWISSLKCSYWSTPYWSPSLHTGQDAGLSLHRTNSMEIPFVCPLNKFKGWLKDELVLGKNNYFWR